MRIRAVEFDGIRGLPDGKRDFPPLDTRPDVIAVTGGPGSGKTTFLDALAAAKEGIAPYGLPDVKWQWLVPLGQPSSRLHLTLGLSPAERTRLRFEPPEIDTEVILGERSGRPPKPAREVVQLLSTWAEDPTIGRVAYFHAERALPPPAPVSAAAGAGMRLANDSMKFNRLSAIVAERRMPALRRASEWLTEATGYSIGRVEPYRGRDEIRFVKPSSDTAVFMSSLSATERQFALFALAFADPGFNDSLILIDSPEIAFGDRRALELLTVLTGWGQNNQFILATTSEAILESLPQSRVVRLG